MAKQKQLQNRPSKLKIIAREIGRFVITIPVFIGVAVAGAYFGCGRVFGHSTGSCVGSSNDTLVFCSATSRLARVCNTRLAVFVATGIVAVVLCLLAWRRKISKAWVIDFVILMILLFIAGKVVDYVTLDYVTRAPV